MAGTHKVVCAAAVKGVAEEIQQDSLPAALHRPEHAIHVGGQLGVFAVLWQRVQDQDNWIQDPGHLQGSMGPPQQLHNICEAPTRTGSAGGDHTTPGRARGMLCEK